LIRNYAEQLRVLDKENKNLKNSVAEKDTSIKKLNGDLFASMEQASLYKEMAKQQPAGMDTFVKSMRDSREMENRKNMEKQQPAGMDTFMKSMRDSREMENRKNMEKQYSLRSSGSTSLKKLPDYDNIINKLKSLKL